MGELLKPGSITDSLIQICKREHVPIERPAEKKGILPSLQKILKRKSHAEGFNGEYRLVLARQEFGDEYIYTYASSSGEDDDDEEEYEDEDSIENQSYPYDITGQIICFRTVGSIYDIRLVPIVEGTGVIEYLPGLRILVDGKIRKDKSTQEIIYYVRANNRQLTNLYDSLYFEDVSLDEKSFIENLLSPTIKSYTQQFRKQILRDVDFTSKEIKFPKYHDITTEPRFIGTIIEDLRRAQTNNNPELEARIHEFCAKYEIILDGQ